MDKGKALVLGLIVFGASLTSGCLGAKRLTANSAGITIDYGMVMEWSTEGVYSLAQEHCESYGKNSLLKLKKGYVFTFECK